MRAHRMRAAAGASPVQFVSASGRRAANSTTCVVTAPTGIQDGDVLVALLFESIGSVSFTYPSGFSESLLASDIENAVAVAWKVASSESGNYTFTRTGGSTGRFCVILLVYRGGTTSSPLQVGTVTKATSATATAASISPSVNGALVAFFATEGAGPSITTAPSGMVQRQFLFAAGSAGASAAYDLIPSGTAATGDKTLVWSVSSSAMGVLVLVKGP